MSIPVHISHAKHKNTIHILAYTTGVCNYHCRYCSFGNLRSTKFLNLDDLRKFIEELHQKRQKNIYIELIGGEPTIDPGILHFTKKLMNNSGITVGIYTNMSLDVQLYKKLCECGAEMTFTWHSLPDDFKNNKFIDKAFDILDSGFTETSDIHVMYENDHIVESENAYVKFVRRYPENTEICLLDRDFDTNTIYFINEKYTKDQLKHYEELKKMQKTGLNKMIYDVDFSDGSHKTVSVQDIYTKQEFYNFNLWRCSAGDDYMYIDVSGNIYPCFNYCLDKTHVIGDIWHYDDLKFKDVICKYKNCPCVWEADKRKLFK